MKKYKLIKEYPGSPKIDTELFLWNGRWRISKNYCCYFLNSHPCDYLEYWEEIKAKPLLITKDNIKAFEGDIIHVVDLGSKICMPTIATRSYENIGENLYHFKNVDNAKDFLINNAESICLKDLIKIGGITSKQIDLFKNKVKQKLNLK